MGDGDIVCKKQKLLRFKGKESRVECKNDEKTVDATAAPDDAVNDCLSDQGTSIVQQNPRLSRTRSSPQIFNLNMDCFDEIFEYLSLKDLHSLGQTCKTLQKVSGEYFKLNYSTAEHSIGKDGIYSMYSDNDGVINQRTQTSCFNQFTKFISHHYEEFEPFRYIEMHSNEFLSLNHLYLVCVGLNACKMNYFKSLLPGIEILQIRQCTIWNGDFYEMLLEFCEKLKKLYVLDDLGDIIHRKSNSWLLKTYPNLQHLELTPRYSFEIIEIEDFFKLNPNIRSFSTNSHCFWINRQSFMKMNIKLDLLEIKHFDSGFYFYHVEKMNIDSICKVMNDLFERGFYKKAHFYIREIDEFCSNQLALLKGLDKLSIKTINGTGNFLAKLNNLKELNIFDCTNATNLDEIASKLVKLERVLLENASYNDVLPFIRKSIQLKQLKIIPKVGQFNNDFLNLIELNKERGKLLMASKLTIFVEDNVFLNTKWNVGNGDTDLEFIEMKRANSHSWKYRESKENGV